MNAPNMELDYDNQSEPIETNPCFDDAYGVSATKGGQMAGQALELPAHRVADGYPQTDQIDTTPPMQESARERIRQQVLLSAPVLSAFRERIAQADTNAQSLQELERNLNKQTDNVQHWMRSLTSDQRKALQGLGMYDTSKEAFLAIPPEGVPPLLRQILTKEQFDDLELLSSTSTKLAQLKQEPGGRDLIVAGPTESRLALAEHIVNNGGADKQVAPVFEDLLKQVPEAVNDKRVRDLITKHHLRELLIPAILRAIELCHPGTDPKKIYNHLFPAVKQFSLPMISPK